MSIEQFLAKNRQRALDIYCIGDAMIDRYFDIKVNRISPEVPMPIMLSENEKSICRPGGVANVAHQLKYFNVRPQLISFVDQLGRSVFSEHNIDLSGCCDTKGTDFLPIKNRFVQDGMQIIRWDIESPNGCLHKWNRPELFFDTIKKWPKTPDVVILSDYNKGFFDDPQPWLKEFKGCTIVDPKKGPVSKWKGCTVFKPNANEAFELSGLKDPKDQCKFFHDNLQCACVIITQSGKGFAGSFRDDYFEYTADKPVQVESTIGAGDAFVAVLAVALGHRIPVYDATRIAFDAGRIYVQKRFNRPIVPAELVENKLVDPQDLVKRDFKLVMTNGCFDFGLTSAHIQCLEFAKKQGDKLLVAINSDDSVRQLKGEGRPLMTFKERAAVVAALECVDFVVEFAESTPIKVIETCRPSVIVKGGDYKKEDVVGYGLAEVVIFPLVQAASTTEKINKLFSV